MIEKNMRNSKRKKHTALFIAIYVLLNITIIFIVYLRILPGHSDKLYIPVNDSDISISQIHSVLQILGKYDENYTLNINGSEFEFGLNMKKVRQILMLSLIVFFIPNFIFFIFLLYGYINSIKDFTQKHKLKIIIFISIEIVMNILLFLWIDPYFNKSKNTTSFVPLKREAVVIDSARTEITGKGWYNSQSTQTISGAEYYIAVDLMRVKEVVLIFLKRFYIYNYIYMIFLIVYMRYAINLENEKKYRNMRITDILFYIGCIAVSVSPIIIKIGKEDVFLYTLFMGVFGIGCMLQKLYLDWIYGDYSRKRPFLSFVRLFILSFIFIKALKMFVELLSG
jgi:hypothetical protein